MVYIDRCLKFNLPNGTTVDILTIVLQRMMEWIQNKETDPESCGFILGYENYNTHNITLSDITIPQDGDYRTRFFCKLVDKFHFNFLKNSRKQKNFYMGVWHTHPQDIPYPSPIDLNDWQEILKNDKTGSDFAFFIILGRKEFKVWVGDFKTQSINEIYESKIENGVYMKG